MVRNYKQKPDDKRLNYIEDDIACALLDLAKGEEPIRSITARYNIPLATLHMRWRGNVKTPGVLGHPIALLQDEERALAANVAALGD